MGAKKLQIHFNSLKSETPPELIDPPFRRPGLLHAFPRPVCAVVLSRRGAQAHEHDAHTVSDTQRYTRDAEIQYLKAVCHKQVHGLVKTEGLTVVELRSDM